ncbi:MAG: TIGR00282 family metallophosphoesterase [Aestuariivita sp.]|nr:TIGR00282 family metallophosphoesterase [Aestuariivita sp.]
MRILFLGDVVGRSGRTALTENLSRLKKEWQVDFAIVNGENATDGQGLSRKHASELIHAGANCITLGDHAFDQKDMHDAIQYDPRILRPVNFARKAPGRGFHQFSLQDGRSLLVAQVLGQLFMKKPYDNPFVAIETVLNMCNLGKTMQALVVDIHCEATSEKMAMGHYCDGRASLVVGTHTHIPTSDAVILKGGTAYLTDAGMCGVYHSIIGMHIDEPMNRFVNGMSQGRLKPAVGQAVISGVLVETDDQTGLAKSISSVRVGELTHGNACYR